MPTKLLQKDAIQILNVSLDNLTSQDLLKDISEKGGIVFTPNVDHLMKLQRDREFQKVYEIASHRVCDSQIIMYAAKFLGTPLLEKISGSDLFPLFYQYNKDNKKIKIFLLGAAEGVAQKAQEIINQKVGRKIIVASYSPSYGFENNEEECEKIITLINDSSANVLAIGVGAPKQEKWIYKYKDRLESIKLFLAIGATIEFEAGYKRRSPSWMSQLGIEWLHRLASEPRRLWKRYLVEGLPFFFLILKQKLNCYKTPFL